MSLTLSIIDTVPASALTAACPPESNAALTTSMPLVEVATHLLNSPTANAMEELNESIGPASAAMPPIATMAVLLDWLRLENHWDISCTADVTNLMMGTAPSPSSARNICHMFERICTCPEKPSAFFAASFAASPACPHWSLTPFHASRDICRLSSSPPTVCMSPSMACFWRTAVMPKPCKTASAEPPDASISLRPSMNAFMTFVGSLSHALAKSDALMCATSAMPCREFFASPTASLTPSNTISGSFDHASTNSSAVWPMRLENTTSELPPSCTAASMASIDVSIVPPADATAVSKKDIVLDTAVPAASAFCPVLAMELAHASTSGADMPTMLAMEPMRSAMLAISVSVDAPLLPSRTSASENPT